LETRQGIKIAALEEIAYINGWISREKLTECAVKYGKSTYGKHLVSVADGKIKY
jgi:glucose-1-phosphate thymidylyltransferase